jgi:hypothetical protein
MFCCCASLASTLLLPVAEAAVPCAGTDEGLGAAAGASDLAIPTGLSVV